MCGCSSGVCGYSSGVRVNLEGVGVPLEMHVVVQKLRKKTSYLPNKNE